MVISRLLVWLLLLIRWILVSSERVLLLIRYFDVINTIQFLGFEMFVGVFPVFFGLFDGF